MYDFNILKTDRTKPIYIKFDCSGDCCNNQFNLVVKNKEFGNIRYGLTRNIEQKVIVCCPYCDHYQYLTLVDFLQIGEDRYFAL